MGPIDKNTFFIIMDNDTVTVFTGANIEQVNFHVAVVWTKIKVFKYIPFPPEQKLIFRLQDLQVNHWC